MTPRSRASASARTFWRWARLGFTSALCLTGIALADPGASPQPAAIPDDYRIAPADVVLVTVFQEDDLKSTLRVSRDGNVTFPLIGSVHIAGLSPSSAADSIRGRLAHGYLIDPQVNLTVLDFSKRRFTVLGQVQKPGAYDMPDQDSVTLLQAIGMAGGYTRIADPRKVTLMRSATEGKETYHFDAKRLASGRGETSFTIEPGDVITVAESLF